jgi:putative Mg2+ transporter-C (MgtC) family protein
MVQLNPSELEIVIRLLVATGLGAAIGLEREFNRSAAGIKTYAIVSLGSALFTVGSLLTDIKAAAGIITGIGFLGAAMIFKNENKVTGLTTAALVWATASIGFAAGLGMYLAAGVTTVLLFILLIPVEWFEKKVLKMHGTNCQT